MALKLIIVGLRRSGTTIFWETFRQDPRLVCYDEPFNPNLWVLPRGTNLKAPEEFIRLVETDAPGFWNRFSPIHFTEELREGLSDRQADYLRFIAGTADSVAVDLTRCLFKIEALHHLAPEAVLVHLYRPAECVATSHLLPTSRGWRGAIRKWIARRDFWTRRDGYNGWSFESIVGNSERTMFAHRLDEIGLDAKTVYDLPAAGRLLALWRLSFERAERDGRRFFGDRFVSQSFDAFCREPLESVERVYRRLSMVVPELDFSRVHPAHGPYQPDAREWTRFRELVGLLER